MDVAQQQSLTDDPICHRTDIKIKTKIPKRNQTSTHTYPYRLLATKRGRESRGREVSFSEPATKRSPNRIKIAGPQNNSEAHVTLPLSSSNRSPSDAQISEGVLSALGLSLSRRIDRVSLKLQLFFILITMAHHDRSIRERVIALAE